MPRPILRRSSRLRSGRSTNSRRFQGSRGLQSPCRGNPTLVMSGIAVPTMRSPGPSAGSPASSSQAAPSPPTPVECAPVCDARGSRCACSISDAERCHVVGNLVQIREQPDPARLQGRAARSSQGSPRMISRGRTLRPFLCRTNAIRRATDRVQDAVAHHRGRGTRSRRAPRPTPGCRTGHTATSVVPSGTALVATRWMAAPVLVNGYPATQISVSCPDL